MTFAIDIRGSFVKFAKRKVKWKNIFFKCVLFFNKTSFKFNAFHSTMFSSHYPSRTWDSAILPWKIASHFVEVISGSQKEPNQVNKVDVATNRTSIGSIFPLVLNLFGGVRCPVGKWFTSYSIRVFFREFFFRCLWLYITMWDRSYTHQIKEQKNTERNKFKS